MGALYKGVCFPDLPTAKAEQCSQSNSVWGATTSAYTNECTSNVFGGSNMSMSMCRRLNGGACFIYSQPYNNYPSCAYDGSVSTSLDYFGAVLGFLVIVYVASQIKRKFWGNHESI